MKKFLVLFSLVLMCSCHYSDNDIKLPNSEFYLEVIDSCEYLIIHRSYGSAIVHKGNCRFCLNRNRV